MLLAEKPKFCCCRRHLHCHKPRVLEPSISPRASQPSSRNRAESPSIPSKLRWLGASRLPTFVKLRRLVGNVRFQELSYRIATSLIGAQSGHQFQPVFKAKNSILSPEKGIEPMH